MRSKGYKLIIVYFFIWI